MRPMIIKSNEKAGFHPLSRKYVFEKPKPPVLLELVLKNHDKTHRIICTAQIEWPTDRFYVKNLF